MSAVNRWIRVSLLHVVVFSVIAALVVNIRRFFLSKISPTIVQCRQHSIPLFTSYTCHVLPREMTHENSDTKQHSRRRTGNNSIQNTHGTRLRFRISHPLARHHREQVFPCCDSKDSSGLNQHLNSMVNIVGVTITNCQLINTLTTTPALAPASACVPEELENRP